MKITVTRDDGTSVDITEGVQVAYQAAYEPTQCYECDGPDAQGRVALDRLAVACGFPTFAERRAEEERKHQEWLAGYERREAERQEKWKQDHEASIGPANERRAWMIEAGWIQP